MLLAGAAIAAAACAEATTPGLPTPTPAPAVSDGGASAAPTLDQAAGFGALIEGDWRRVPFDARSSADLDRIDATCRAAAPGIGSLPLAVADTRGRGRVTFVYASSPTSAAWECLAASTAATAADVTVRSLQESGDPIADEAIDVLDYRVAELGDITGVVLVGRIGPQVVKVITQFDGDESYIYGSKGGGWYALWWPGTNAINGVSATDTHNIVVGHVVPELY